MKNASFFLLNQLTHSRELFIGQKNVYA